MLRDARKAAVDVILLSDHFRPPRDFMDSWRGLRDGVLFIPGSEMHGFVIHPDESMMGAMKKGATQPPMISSSITSLPPGCSGPWNPFESENGFISVPRRLGSCWAHSRRSSAIAFSI